MTASPDRPEESWEADVAAALSGLPPVDPPTGFIEAALDHRPLHSGRALAILGALAVAVLTIGFATDGAGSVSVPVEELAEQHTAASLAMGEGGGSTPDVDRSTTTAPDRLATAMADAGYREVRVLEAGSGQQRIYRAGDRSVSLFIDRGAVAWSELSAGASTTVAGHRAWIDEERDVVVVQIGGDVVAFVGLTVGDVDAIVAGVASDGSMARARSFIDRLAVQLGADGR